MKVNDLIEFLEYSDRKALVVVGIADESGRVATSDDVLFLKQDNRVCLIVQPNARSTAESDARDLVSLADAERTQLFGHNFVLLQKPPDPSS